MTHNTIQAEWKSTSCKSDICTRPQRLFTDKSAKALCFQRYLLEFLDMTDWKEDITWIDDATKKYLKMTWLLCKLETAQFKTLLCPFFEAAASANSPWHQPEVNVSEWRTSWTWKTYRNFQHCLLFFVVEHMLLLTLQQFEIFIFLSDWRETTQFPSDWREGQLNFR